MGIPAADKTRIGEVSTLGGKAKNGRMLLPFTMGLVSFILRHLMRTNAKRFGLFNALFRLTLVVGAILPAYLIAQDDEDGKTVEFHGPGARPGYPDVFHVGYKLRKDLVSPDGRYGVIYYRLNYEEGMPVQNFLVEIKTHRILGIVNEERPYFAGKNHGGLSARWAPDSSAVLVINESKWAPESMVLVEMRDGQIARQTELLEGIEKMFKTDVAKAERIPLKDAGIGEIAEIKVDWKMEKPQELHLSCEGDTNPKGLSNLSKWDGKLKAVWDLQQHRWSQQHVTRISYRKAGKEIE